MRQQGHSVQVGSITFPNPVMTASGTVGHGTELAAYCDLANLGAVAVSYTHLPLPTILLV